MDINDDKRIYTLSLEKPYKAVLKMGVPLIAGMLIMVLYNLVDTYFIGLMKDDYRLAAVNLAYPVMMIMIAVSNMIGSGSASLIARSLGAGCKEKADHTLTTGLLLTVINSTIVTAAGLLFLP
ncbi:MAG: oligosaccharide flippase family protein, partial [Clostridia bacterium]|nr:oligosaccharide flippase family protein [Clostridia bacterium]